VEVKRGTWVAVKGARERRQVRFARLKDTWSTDHHDVAKEWGFPVFRYREEQAGLRTEVWSYPAAHVEIVFNREGQIIERRLR
jgi:hypothetical protein